MSAQGRFLEELIIISPLSFSTHQSSSTHSGQGSSKTAQPHNNSNCRSKRKNRKKQEKWKASNEVEDLHHQHQSLALEIVHSPESDQESSTSCSSTTMPSFQAKKSSSSSSALAKKRRSSELANSPDSDQESSSCSTTTMPSFQAKKSTSSTTLAKKRRCPIGPAKLVWVSTKKGVGANIIHGLMYPSRENAKIVCHCHKRHFSMAQFVQHGGGSPTHIAKPLLNLTVRMGFS